MKVYPLDGEADEVQSSAYSREPGLFHTPPGRSMEGSYLSSSAYPGFARGEEGGHQGRAFKAEDAA